MAWIFVLHREDLSEQPVSAHLAEVARIDSQVGVLVRHEFLPVLHNVMPLLYGLAFLTRETENVFRLIATLCLYSVCRHQHTQGEDGEGFEDIVFPIKCVFDVH